MNLNYVWSGSGNLLEEQDFSSGGDGFVKRNNSGDVNGRDHDSKTLSIASL